MKLLRKENPDRGKPVAGNPFDCIAQMPDDSQYYYKISSAGSDTLSVKIKKAANKGGEKYRRMQCGVITDILKRKKNPQKNLSGCPDGCKSQNL